ncbi:hypothetical protein HMPREF0645_1925 [Hallella bergensis DSM 17361]|uniref:Uncharacterized protein n=1 Tax=Hallella bergensis DSM 17361 TaxID=585502 RepID=D1PY90_9BACT|nr:hypothetical protein [Hallella bergensis]EFA43641.1 hypothetical protein HMPREF0645_1925 [Hallella bergensis DSM 17361]
MKNSILLIGGVVLTLLFVVFASSIYECFGLPVDFSYEMYNDGHYFVTSVISSVVAWGVAGLFYYVINSVSFSRWYHWLISLLAASALSSVIIFAYLDNTLTEGFSSSLFSFCVINFAATALLYLVASFAMRWWSSNCRHTPIPE